MKQTLLTTTLITLFLVGAAIVPGTLSAQEEPELRQPSCDLGAIPQVAKEREEFNRQYDGALAWVQGLSASSVPQSYEELIQYTAPARLAIFSELPAERVQNFWETHFERYLYGSDALTPEQTSILEQTLELIADVGIYEGDSNGPEWQSKYEAEVLELAVAIEEHFDSQMLTQIFLRPAGKLSPGLDLALPDKSGRPNCNCIFWCDNPQTTCFYPPRGCRQLPNCGIGGFWTCTKVCGILF